MFYVTPYDFWYILVVKAFLQLGKSAYEKGKENEPGGFFFCAQQKKTQKKIAGVARK